MVEFEREGISLLGFCGLENEISDARGLPVDLVQEGAAKPRVARELDEPRHVEMGQVAPRSPTFLLHRRSIREATRAEARAPRGDALD